MGDGEEDEDGECDAEEAFNGDLGEAFEVVGDEPDAKEDEEEGEEIGADAKAGLPDVDPGVGDLAVAVGEDGDEGEEADEGEEDANDFHFSVGGDAGEEGLAGLRFTF